MLRTGVLQFLACQLILCFLLYPLGLAQTKVIAPKNPYDIKKDVELGQQAATEAERQLPLIQDRQVQSYLERVGSRLATGIPANYQYPEFRYSFKVTDLKELNAFALPGGFTYVNRGLIEAARNEGELAGVMAHEISHVALRHGTAQAAKAQKYAIGAAAGQILGSIIGGGAGGAIAQGTQFGVGAYFLKFSREYERQADTLGAQIMANAGYDPRDLANVFKTLESSSGGRGGPELLSSHPNPGNRNEAINREAQLLKVKNPLRDNGDFGRIQAKLKGLPVTKAPANSPTRNDSTANNNPNNSGEPGKEPRRGPTPTKPLGGNVALPDTRYRTYNSKNQLFQLDIPRNWQELPGQNEVTFAPDGAFGELQQRFVFTHGVMLGSVATKQRDLRRASDEFISALKQGNPNLSSSGSYQRTTIDGREALAMSFTNTSEVTGRPEAVTIYTILLSNGQLFYVIPVVPQTEVRNYQRAFQTVVKSILLND
jgi:beta-barrel assembly-enhancing protease